ncbi:MAG: hypothetical protein GXO64_03100 [Candidatus Micrarchaeota archaeon]|nr:hypothetical protein [Candidatus Micrarchaeota archaeon]
MPFFFEGEEEKSKENDKFRTPHPSKKFTMGGDLLVDDGILKKNYAGGDYVFSKTEMDQFITVNPDCLPGQAEIIYMVFLYRLVKWHFIPMKADEYLEMNPIHAPPFFTMTAAKEKLEQQIKQGLSYITQATADYELFKSDLRKYGEILDYFVQAKKGEEHVLRGLFVDRVDAHTGEGYSMISISRRWPTIITDFINLREDWTDVDTIMKELKVPRAEAIVLKTKNEIYKHWKKYFFRDVKDRYARIKNLLQAHENQLEEYANWLKPYVNKYKRIREVSEIEPSFFLTNAQIFAFTPFSGLRTRLWYYRGFEPEEMGKGFEELGEIDPVDDFVIGWVKKFEEHYGVSFVRKYNKQHETDLPIDDDKSRRTAIRAIFDGLTEPTKRMGHEMVSYVTLLDKRYRYFAFYDIFYEADYIKGSQGPLELEDIYYHIFPAVISINALLVLHLELMAREMRFERYIHELIGTSDIEGELKKELDEIFKETEMKTKIEELKKQKKTKEAKKLQKELDEMLGIKEKTLMTTFRGWGNKGIKPINSQIAKLLPFLRKKGPYETNLKERLSKEFANYLGNWTNDIYGVLKEICYKMSGVRP